MSDRLGDRRGTDTGSLPLVLLLTLVATALSALATPILLVQFGSTRAETGQMHAMHAAQAGLDVALAYVRAADPGTGYGQLAKLPCGPLNGRVSDGGPAAYQVTVNYLAADPYGRSDAWVTANRISCAAGTGPVATPGYLVLLSRGTDGTRSWTLRATYVMRTTNPYLPGGLIPAYPGDQTGGLCMDAGSASPTSGTLLLMQPCRPGSEQQLFAYRPDLTILLVSSQTSATPNGMCVDAVTPHTTGGGVFLAPCAVPAAAHQQWIYNGNRNFQGTSNGSTVDGYCLNAGTSGQAGSTMVLGGLGSTTCGSGADNAVKTFLPDPQVAAGSAGVPAGQLANFSQYSRCLDVTNQNASSSYLVITPCQQSTSPATVAWDQNWTFPTAGAGTSGVSGVISNPHTGTCLHNPGSTAPGQYVTLVTCPGGTPPAQLTWTVYGDTGINPTSYQIRSSDGYCLAATDPNATPPDLDASGQSKLVVVVCDGSAREQWNAPPGVLQPMPLTNVVQH